MTLKIRRGYGNSADKNSEHTQKLRVIEDQPAKIRLDDVNEFVNAADEFKLCGFIKNKDSAATVEYYWEFEADDDGRQ